MAHPEIVVVLHRRVKLLHKLRPVSTLGDSTIDLVFGIHELFVFAVDFVDNAWSVNALVIAVPINSGELLGASRLLIIVIKNGRQLSLHLAGLVVVGGVAKSV